jgi:hypothetical protein
MKITTNKSTVNILAPDFKHGNGKCKNGCNFCEPEKKSGECKTCKGTKRVIDPAYDLRMPIPCPDCKSGECLCCCHFPEHHKHGVCFHKQVECIHCKPDISEKSYFVTQKGTMYHGNTKIEPQTDKAKWYGQRMRNEALDVYRGKLIKRIKKEKYAQTKIDNTIMAKGAGRMIDFNLGLDKAISLIREEK